MKLTHTNNIAIMCTIALSLFVNTQNKLILHFSGYNTPPKHI